MKYELAIFDLDGTILNTIDDLADSMNATLEKFNFPTHPVEKVKYMVGNGIPKLVERAVPDGKNNPKYSDVLSSFINYYEKHSTIKTAPYNGMIETLLHLKSIGVKLAVNSNKLESAVIPLCKKYFPEIFDYISGGHLNQPPKPDPSGVNIILKKSEIERTKAVYIGDSDVDIQTAKNAEIDEIACSWGFRGSDFLKDKGAKIIIDTPKDILNFFK
ncbi:MAG: HAD family hydrolase [Spirochaetia bacterium]|nr:HAD family hydrolase [Spirochaetia bacterium]